MVVSHMNNGIRPHAISLPISLDFILLYGSVRICFWNHPQKHKNPQKPDNGSCGFFHIYFFLIPRACYRQSYKIGIHPARHAGMPPWYAHIRQKR